MSMIITNCLKKKVLLAQLALLASFTAQNCHHATNFFCPEISVTVTFENFSSWDRSDPGPFSRMRITSSVTQDGVRLLVVNFLSV